jgi:hypothetical protein
VADGVSLEGVSRDADDFDDVLRVGSELVISRSSGYLMALYLKSGLWP